MTTPTQAQIEAAARALHNREMERGEHANSVLSIAMQKPITGASTEPFDEHAEMWRGDALAALTAAAEAEKYPTGLEAITAFMKAQKFQGKEDEARRINEAAGRQERVFAATKAQEQEMYERELKLTPGLRCTAASKVGGEKAEDRTITNQREVARIKAAAKVDRRDEPCKICGSIRWSCGH